MKDFFKKEKITYIAGGIRDTLIVTSFTLAVGGIITLFLYFNSLYNESKWEAKQRILIEQKYGTLASFTSESKLRIHERWDIQVEKTKKIYRLQWIDGQLIQEEEIPK